MLTNQPEPISIVAYEGNPLSLSLDFGQSAVPETFFARVRYAGTATKLGNQLPAGSQPTVSMAGSQALISWASTAVLQPRTWLEIGWNGLVLIAGYIQLTRNTAGTGARLQTDITVTVSGALPVAIALVGSGSGSGGGGGDWASITGKPAAFPPIAHNHDERYYTEAEADDRFQPKGAAADWNSISSKPASYPPSAHNHDDRYYTESEADARFKPNSYQPDWSGITGKPLTFTPAAHNQDASTITSGVLSVDRLPNIPIEKLPVLPGQKPVVSSGGLANLTTAQQAEIGAGTVVTTTDGFRWVYSGTGDKTQAASYTQLADITPDWNAISGKPGSFPSSVAEVSGLSAELAGKVNQEAGKGLSSQDFTLTEKNKLGNIQAGATANATNEQLRDRGTHTGAQAMDTITGLQQALDGKAEEDHNHDGLYKPANYAPTFGDIFPVKTQAQRQAMTPGSAWVGVAQVDGASGLYYWNPTAQAWVGPLGQVTNPPTSPTYQSLSISGPNPKNINEGGTYQATVTALYSDGSTQDVTSQATLGVTEGTISAAGLVSVAANAIQGDNRNMTVTASWNGKTAPDLTLAIIDSTPSPVPRSAYSLAATSPGRNLVPNTTYGTTTDYTGRNITATPQDAGAIDYDSYS